MNTAEFIKVLEAKNIPYTTNRKWVCVYGSCVDLDSPTTISGNIKFKSYNGVGLRSLTKLSDNIKFENGGFVYLPSLSSPFQIYSGQQIELRNIDGFTMLITSKRALGESEIYRAKYFGGGDIKDLDDCYIAKRGGVYAHGFTAKKAIDDLNFKLAERVGKKDVIDCVKKSQQVTVKDFHIVTGACREGIRQHLLSHKIDADRLESMSLDDALEAMRGTSYGEIFKSELEGNVE